MFDGARCTERAGPGRIETGRLAAASERVNFPAPRRWTPTNGIYSALGDWLGVEVGAGVTTAGVGAGVGRLRLGGPGADCCPFLLVSAAVYAIMV